MKKPVVATIGAVAAALVSMNVVAFPHDCWTTRVSVVSPVHAQTTDSIEYRVTVNPVHSPGDPSNPRYVFSKIATSSGNRITIKVIVSPSSQAIEGYIRIDDLTFDPAGRALGASALGLYSTKAVLGTLEAGEYEISESVLFDDPLTGRLVSPCAVQHQRLVIYDANASGLAPVVEFYHAGLDHYFLTQDTNEIRDLDTGVHVGWARTGQSFIAYMPGQSDGRLLPVKRYYGRPSAGLNSHLYSLSNAMEEEVSLTIGPLRDSWMMETRNAFELSQPNYLEGTCPTGTVPVYRLWNQRSDSNHRYTTDRATKIAMIARGYVAEGWGDDVVYMCAL